MDQDSYSNAFPPHNLLRATLILIFFLSVFVVVLIGAKQVLYTILIYI